MRQLLKSGMAAEAAFAAAFFLLPLSKSLTYTALLAAFVMFFASERFVEARHSWRMQPWVLPALALAVVPWLSLLIHRHAAQEPFYLYLSYYWLLAFVTWLAAGTMRIQSWIRAFLAGVLIVFCYVEIRFPGQLDSATGLAALGNYILYSQFLAVAVVLLSILYRHEARRHWRLLYLAGMSVFFFGLVSGSGRSGLLAVVVLLPFIIGNLFPGLSRTKILLGCLIAVVIVLMSPKVQTRISAGVNDLKLLQHDNAQTSLGYRAEMWKTAWQVWREHPVLGAGPYGFREEWHKRTLSDEAQAFVEPHNAFLFYASSYGLLGLGALVWLYAALLRTGWRERHSLEGGIAFAVAVIVIFGSLTNTMFMGATSRAWLMLFIGLQGALLQRRVLEKA